MFATWTALKIPVPSTSSMLCHTQTHRHTHSPHTSERTVENRVWQ